MAYKYYQENKSKEGSKNSHKKSKENQSKEN
jgi:hypothetical protein